MRTSSGRPSPTPPATDFAEAARAAEAELVRDARDAALDGTMTRFEAAELQHRMTRLTEDLRAYVGARERYSDSADQLVANLKG